MVFSSDIKCTGRVQDDDISARLIFETTSAYVDAMESVPIYLII